MLSLKAQKREKFGRQTNKLREQGILPAVLYGEGVKSAAIEVNQKEFEKVFKEAGTSSLIILDLGSKKYEVLIHSHSSDPLTGEILHIDFYKPSTKREISAEIPLVFEGEAPAVKDLGGNLLKEIQTLEVKGLAHSLPKEIKIDLAGLKTFEDKILIKDIKMPEGVKAVKEEEDIVALVMPPREEEIEEEKPAGEEAGEEKLAKEKTMEEEKKTGEENTNKSNPKSK